MGRLVRFIVSVLDPRAYLHFLRLAHYYNYSHVEPRRRAKIGSGVALAPNVSFRNGERIEIGDHAHIGGRCYLWAGDSAGRIVIGEDALFGPEVYLTASDYETAPGEVVYRQPKRERDVVIGRGVWLGARVIVVAGVTIGDGAIVGAGSVVTRDIPPNAIAVGIPARVVRMRDGSQPQPAVAA
jgi:acetyltransferase-like isoleucine patch superfamily enzyme